ncbi:DUF5994 family protein [Arthrobacter sp. NEB 688]|uniref:DUF5994 family protein n=1 Tax=Arthrobacter sp. NEB 688 TaxID=904039 RepID=UPI00156519C2|nr:DUF5994 family protein [Arthrobacter sp. NEB 688]QKE85090.1 hypothetical protein HL663_14880 [Arthrobacter sp. NEB 688]
MGTENSTARLALSLAPGQLVLHGAWWPRSHRLDEELPPLDLAMKDATGAGVARFAYTVGTWTDQPRKVRTATHMIKIGWFSTGDFPDSVDLSLDDYRRAVLVVIPPEASEDEAHVVMSRFAAAGAAGGFDATYRSSELPADIAADIAAVKESFRRAIGSIRRLPEAGPRTLAATALEVDLAVAATEARTVALHSPEPTHPAEGHAVSTD